MALINLIVKVAKKSTNSLPKSSSSRSGYVNEVKAIGQVKPLERRIAVAVKPTLLIEQTNTRDENLLVTALLTKYPHYTFVKKCKSTNLGKIKFWFKDTKRNVTIVFGYKDMQEELHLSLYTTLRLQEQGFNPEYIDKEQFIPNYCIVCELDYNVLRKIKYDIHMLKKYGKLHPFNTNIDTIYREKFDYTEHGMSV